MRLFTKKPSIRTVLLSVNLAVLLLPLAGIWGFRLYETELIRRTEAELISQTVLIKEMFLREFDRLGLDEVESGKLLGPRIDLKYRELHIYRDGQFRKIYPRLDISSERKRDPIQEPEISTALSNENQIKIARELTSVLHRAQFNLLSAIRIVAADGTVIASTSEATGYNLIEREEIRRALSGEPLSIIRQRAQRDLPTHSMLSYGTGVIVFVVQPVVVKNRILGAIIASRTPMNLANAIFEHRYQMMRFFALILALVLIAATVTAATIGGPIRRLAAMTVPDRHGRPVKIKPIKNPGTAEVAALSEAFAAMSASMHERADYNEGLVRSVSHEFKTPIASIHASVEILEDHLDTMTGVERKKFLTMIGKDSFRLQRLVERLLELARADAIMNPAGNCEPASVLAEIFGDFSGLCPDLQIEGSEETKNALVAMPREAFHSSITNVVQNSISHGGDNISIQIKQIIVGNLFNIVVTDSGSGIDPHDRGKIFDPFFTTAREKGGTGLGLSIVKSLVEAYGGSVVLNHPAKGLIVTISLPIT